MEATTKELDKGTTINEFLHLPLEEIIRRLRAGELKMSHRGEQRRDKMIKKKGSPEYNISRWDFLGARKQGIDGIRFFVFTAYSYKNPERTLFSIIFDSDFNICEIGSKLYGPFTWGIFELDLTKTMADLLEEAKWYEGSRVH